MAYRLCTTPATTARLLRQQSVTDVRRRGTGDRADGTERRAHAGSRFRRGGHHNAPRGPHRHTTIPGGCVSPVRRPRADWCACSCLPSALFIAGTALRRSGRGDRQRAVVFEPRAQVSRLPSNKLGLLLERCFVLDAAAAPVLN